MKTIKELDDLIVKKKHNLRRTQVLLHQRQFEMVRAIAFHLHMSISEVIRIMIHDGAKRMKNSKNPKLVEIVRKYFEN